MAQNKKWALDTNVIFDLARNLEHAHALRELALEKKYLLLVTRTSIAEIVHKSARGIAEEQRLAHLALRSLSRWNVSLLETPAGSEAITEQFSAFLRSRGVLPHNEVNDGIILAEASLGGAALLVSSDSHLARIDPDELRLIFEDRGLEPMCCHAQETAPGFRETEEVGSKILKYGYNPATFPPHRLLQKRRRGGSLLAVPKSRAPPAH